MSARVQLIGKAEFLAALRNLPEELAKEGQVIVEAHAAEHARATVALYQQHQKTGRLAGGVTTKQEYSRASRAAIVRTRAPHAWIFDNGTRKRQTRKGANRGVMPARPESERFIPRAIRARERMTRALIDLVRRAGFEVTA